MNYWSEDPGQQLAPAKLFRGSTELISDKKTGCLPQHRLVDLSIGSVFLIFIGFAISLAITDNVRHFKFFVS